MSLAWKQQKFQIQELSVFGYIRIYCKSCIIPKELKQLCLLFYITIIDEWNVDKSHPDFLCNNKSLILGIEQGTSWRNAIGSLVIIKGELQTWKFKVIDQDSNFWILIGIVNADSSILWNQPLWKQATDHFCELETYSYAYYGMNGQKISGKQQNREREKYGICWNSGDIITMILDMTTNKNKKYGTLSYKVNDQDQGIAFNDIDINDKKYCMAICTFASAQIQILHH